MHRPRAHIAEELADCIRCNECLAACPALAAPITIETLNRQTLDGPLSAPVIHFAQTCYLCGACVPVCPVGLHRDTMMLWLKMRLLRSSTQPAHESNENEHEDESPTTSSQAWTARGWRDD
jgi:Na+-translocating ferredoxin:NAD+ oxidoreductase RnfC subunit